MPLRAVALNRSLKPSGQRSSTDAVIDLILKDLAQHGVEGTTVRITDHNIEPGVVSDEGAGDAWPDLQWRVLEAHIPVVGTPIWIGRPSSVCKRVLERLDAFLDLPETPEPVARLRHGRAQCRRSRPLLKGHSHPGR